jgi:predicted metal-dependent hydrolase
VPERRVLHPDLSPEERRRLFQEGIDYFNRGEFFLSHEAWEEIWRSTTPEPRELFQGLVQVAAGLHQILDLKRKLGPRNTLAKARSHLEPCAPITCGLDIDGLLQSVRQWQDWLEWQREGNKAERPANPTIRVIDAEAVR